MKIILDLAEKVIEVEGNITESRFHALIDVIAERFIDFEPRIMKRKQITSADLFKKMMEDMGNG